MRLRTILGLASALLATAGCSSGNSNDTGTNVNTTAQQPYTADYYFYGP